MVNISWSALQVWEECKQKRFLQITKKKDPGRDVRNFFPGTVVDRVMRQWLQGSDLSMCQLVDILLPQLEHEINDSPSDGWVKWRSQIQRNETITYCKELVTRLEPLLREHVIPYDYHPEFRFKAPLVVPNIDNQPETIYLQGGIDLLCKDEKDNWIGFDLKSTKNNDYWRKCLGQAIFYDVSMRAVFKDGGFHKFAFIQPMCDEQVKWVIIGPDERRAMVSRIMAMATATMKDDWEPKRSNGSCTSCEVKTTCIKFRPVEKNKLAFR